MAELFDIYEIASEIYGIKADILAFNFKKTPMNISVEFLKTNTLLPDTKKYEDLPENDKATIRLEERRKKAERLKKEADADAAKVNKFVSKVYEDILWFQMKLTELTAIMSRATTLVDKIIKIGKNALGIIYDYCMNQINIVILLIEKKLLYVKHKINDINIRILTLVKNGKCTQALMAVMSAIIIGLQAVAAAIQAGLQAIQKLIDMIPSNFKIGGEGISFFITPKNPIASAGMPIINPHISVINYLADVVVEQIHNLINTPIMLQITEKMTTITSAIATAQAVLNIPELKEIPNLPIIQPEKDIKAAIDLIISLIPLSQPLPKYEKLNMILNLGFLIFLSTGWCRAGQVSFGLPGQLVGSPASYSETSETA